MNNNTLSDEQILDLSMVSVIMGKEVFEKAYNGNKHNLGYIAVTEQIAKWAIDFQKKYGRMTAQDWEEVLEDPTKHDLDEQVMCWDDAVMFFAHKKCTEWLAGL